MGLDITRIVSESNNNKRRYFQFLLAFPKIINYNKVYQGRTLRVIYLSDGGVERDL